MLTPAESPEYEKQACRDTERWLEESAAVDFSSRWLRRLSRPVMDFLERRCPSGFVEGIELLLAESLDKCYEVGQFTTSYNLIFHRLGKMGVVAQDPNQLRLLDLKPLDGVARAFFTEHAMFAALEGGSCGLGGITFAMADLPMLLTLIFRLVSQIGMCYGFSPEGEEAKLFALKILTLGLMEDGGGSRIEKWRALNSQPRNWVKHRSEKNVAVIGKERLFLNTCQKLIGRLGIALTQRKIFALMPLAGGVVNAGINYFGTQRCAETAFHLFRYRLLKARGYFSKDSDLSL